MCPALLDGHLVTYALPLLTTPLPARTPLARPRGAS